MQPGRPLKSVEFIATAAGTMRMLLAAKPFSQTSPFLKGFIGGLGIAGDSDVVRDLVVPRCDVLVGDRPVVGAVVLALDLEIVRQKPRHVGKPVKCCAA